MSFQKAAYQAHIGYVKSTEYLPFLVEVRTAIELPYQDTAEVITRIFEITKKPYFSSFVEKHGGLDGLINEVVPTVISSIHTISKPIKQSLLEAGFDTVAKN
jgi:hypothetical protein